MNAIRHALQQPFITATGLAAFVHSTWALGTLFGGKPPIMAISLEFAYWLIPAMLIAFALDIGQVVTSVEIRAGNRTKAKYVTFAVFAVANYFLQWLYMAHHMPALELASGVRDSWGGAVQLIRDGSLWVIPSFLPLSTLLYTLSGDPHNHVEVSHNHVGEAPLITLPEMGLVPVSANIIIEPTIEDDQLIECPSCDWSGVYATQKQAAQALRAHKVHCNKRVAKEQNATLWAE